MKVASLAMAMLLAAWGSAAQADEQDRWQQVENKENCAVWNGNPHPNETMTWSGVCANGKTQGRGTLIGRYLEDGEWKGGEYTGETKDGKIHGRGAVVSAEGHRYEGDFKDGKIHGRGAVVWAEGHRYEGDFKDGKVHGRGVMVWANGDRYEGDFKDGKRYERGAITLANGDECEGDWREGRLLETGEAWRNGQFKKRYLDGNTIRYTD